MGIFDKFRKKKQDDAAYESILDESTEAAPEEEPARSEPAAPTRQAEEEIPDVHAILASIREQHPAAEWQGDNGLQFPCGLELRLTIGSVDHYPKGVCVQFLFVMWHPFFDEDLVESVAGIGRTEAEAIEDGIMGFTRGVLPYVLSALECTGEHTIRTELQGKAHVFREPCLLGALHRGAGQAADLWEIVKEQIPQYLGTKKAYWIKLLSSRMGKDICEVRINGMVFHDLTEVLYDAIRAGKSTADGTMDKMFLLLIQDDVSYTPAPFTKAEAASVAQRALQKMMTIEDDESHASVMEEIRQMHPILGGEACAFLPELYSRALVRYKPSDSLLPVSLDIGAIRSSQVRSFGYFDAAVRDYLQKRRPGTDDHVKIFRLSAEYKAIHQAVQNGSKPENLTFAPLAFDVPEGYVIW